MFLITDLTNKQRQFQNAAKQHEITDGILADITWESKEKDLNNQTTANPPNSTVESNTEVTAEMPIKRRPFTSQELKYLNQLINDYNNEQPRKLFWRFIQKFTNWNDTQKSYQKFYHKYWTLTNEKRHTINSDRQKQRKRSLQTLDWHPLNQPHSKHIKLY